MGTSSDDRKPSGTHDEMCYVGKVMPLLPVSASATVDVARLMTYECSRCDFRTPVQIVERGSGGAAAPLGVGIELAAQKARTRAQEAAAHEFRFTVRVVPCPACGARDASTMQRLKSDALLASALAFLGSAALVYFTGPKASSTFLEDTAVRVAFTIASVVGFVVYMFMRRRWASAHKRVRFLSDVTGTSAYR